MVSAFPIPLARSQRLRATAVAVIGVLAWAGGAMISPLRAAEKGEVTPLVRSAIVRVIDAQLAAFRAGDIAAAYAFAATEFRAQRSLPAFAQIVRGSYPEIWNSTKADFGPVRTQHDRAMITVMVYSETGDASYDYSLVREEAGWRIIGVLRGEAKRKA